MCGARRDVVASVASLPSGEGTSLRPDGIQQRFLIDRIICVPFLIVEIKIVAEYRGAGRAWVKECTRAYRAPRTDHNIISFAHRYNSWK